MYKAPMWKPTFRNRYREAKFYKREKKDIVTSSKLLQKIKKYEKNSELY